MIWLFATAVLILAVYHARFRKVLLWTAGGLVTLVIFIAVAMNAPHYDQQPQQGDPVALNDLPDDLVSSQREWCASASSSSMDARTAAITKAACSP